MANASDAKLITALRKWGGMPALAAKELGITRQAVHARIKSSPDIQAAIAEIADSNLDVAEGHLIRKMRAGDKDAVKFYLTQQGKKRGYGNSVSIGFEDAQIEAFIQSLGGSVEAYRNALRQLGVLASEIP